MENLATAFLSLSREERALLGAIESGMKAHEWVPSSIISDISGLPARKVDFLLGRLFEKKLVERESLHYLGYRIDFDAYDLLALSDLVAKGALNAIGERIGVGKESVVYRGFGEMPLALKFHRQGRTSFKHVRRVRHNFPNKSRVPWLYTASLAARHEHKIMEKLCQEVSIPRPVAVSRHVLAMEFVSGPPLNRIVLSDPADGLDLILAEVAKALRLGIIHADLSEFNILVAESGPKIIDWPQAVEVTHPHARELLVRDLDNVLSFFQRKYGIRVPLEEALQRMQGAERI
ncbi:MAG TPA: RIO1 family regulatory kinase/ATPase [Methanothrix sp.]|nr:RIO1 family regulatory kinase/ATPase [Methanothrix sp.]